MNFKPYKIEILCLLIFIMALSIAGCSSTQTGGTIASMERAIKLEQYKQCQRYFREYRKRGIVLIPNEETCRR